MIELLDTEMFGKVCSMDVMGASIAVHASHIFGTKEVVGHKSMLVKCMCTCIRL